MKPAPTTRLFVYGTLQRGCANHSYLANQRFLGEARTGSGHSLYLLDGYPGMVRLPGNPDGVTGEIWEVDAGCLARVDELEGLAEGWYERVPIQLLPPFDRGLVQSYLYRRSVAGRTHLGSTWLG